MQTRLNCFYILFCVVLGGSVPRAWRKSGQTPIFLITLLHNSRHQRQFTAALIGVKHKRSCFLSPCGRPWRPRWWPPWCTFSRRASGQHECSSPAGLGEAMAVYGDAFLLGCVLQDELRQVECWCLMVNMLLAHLRSRSQHIGRLFHVFRHSLRRGGRQDSSFPGRTS